MKILNLRKFTDSFLNVFYILLIDLCLSITASACALVVSQRFVTPDIISLDFGVMWVVLSSIVSLIGFYVLKTYRIVIRHSTLLDIARFILFSTLKSLLVLAFASILSETGKGRLVFISILDGLFTFTLLMLVRVMMVTLYEYVKPSFLKHSGCRKNVLIYGTKEKSVSLITRLKYSSHYNPVGYLIHEPGSFKKQTIAEYKVFGFREIENVRQIKERYIVDGIVFATDEDVKNEQERLIRFASELGLKLLISPSLEESECGKPTKQNIREIKIEDLLSRPEIKISMKEIIENFNGKVVMVTGAAGSIGSELCRQLATFGISQLVLFDSAETPMHNLRLELEERYPHLNFVPVVGDVRLKNRVDYVMRKYHPQVVFHAAAYKHVPLMEEHPAEAVFANVVGTANVAEKCIEYGVEKMVMISTDKAVNPTNVMGCTKRLAEIYVQSLGLAVDRGEVKGLTKFVTTRFGNVLGSNGSVILRFREQIAKGGPVTVTHPEITRYFMTIPEACRLVMEAATMTNGNQIFVFDMGAPVKIDMLARKMIELADFVPNKDIMIEYTGLRPGEKLYEEVLANTENTLPTSHDHIRIAKVREYDYSEARAVVEELDRLSREVRINEVIQLMKKTVPEYKSNNSRFEVFDR